MPWKTVSLMSIRLEFIQFAKRDGVNFRDLCSRYGVSPKTAYKWLARFNHLGLEGLKDQSRRPSHSPLKTSSAIEQTILELRDQHPAWGARKVKARLEALGFFDLPSPSTITAIFRRHGRMSSAPTSSKPFQSFEHPEPNHLWQMDFKGDFLINRQRCYPLTILDDHSRFNLCLQACRNQQTLSVQNSLTHTFRQYGLPYKMLMDNGPPWGYDSQHPYTPLTLWLIRLGIRVYHSRPYHPQTQGKEERFHRTLNAELLRYNTFYSLDHCQHHFDQWRNIYNLERPHQSLQMATPITRYRPSSRPFPETLQSIEYGPEDIVRKVDNAKGFIKFKGRRIKLGKPFKNHLVALRPTLQDGLYDVYFCSQRIKQVNLNAS